MTALWQIEGPDGPRWARGEADIGPVELLPEGVTLAALLAAEGPGLSDIDSMTSGGPVLSNAPLRAPVDQQEIWAAGVTYLRSRDARMEESKHAPDHYDRVYEAERPELFFKSTPDRVRAPDAAVAVREDSKWNVPEPELAAVIAADGEVVGYAIGDDVSSRTIEGENPLYLPQAKVYSGSCAIGPCIVPRDQAPELDQMQISLTVEREDETIYRDEVAVADLRRHPTVLAEWLFRGLSFPSGAILLTGTAIVPPSDFTLTPGDQIEMSITGLGVLRNQVELLRTGPPSTRS